MNITIKFRGTTCKSRFYPEGKTVYGNSLSYFGGENGPQIAHEAPKGWETIPVKPESVTIRAFANPDGKEFYVGDIIERDGVKWQCQLVPKWVRL